MDDETRKHIEKLRDRYQDEVAKNMRMNAIELPESWEVENAS